MDKITPALVAELRRLEAEATPGPWTWQDDDGSPALYGPCPILVAVEVGIPPDAGIALHSIEADRALIAAARNALPALLDEIEALRRLRDAVLASDDADKEMARMHEGLDWPPVAERRTQAERAKRHALAAERARLAKEGGQ